MVVFVLARHGTETPFSTFVVTDYDVVLGCAGATLNSVFVVFVSDTE